MGELVEGLGGSVVSYWPMIYDAARVVSISDAFC